ncbi:MAG: leucine-rich repeat protein [Ruminococcus sp.]|nr:leucine-rich repeat protein [Ruminococcus sp.]
MKNSKRITAAVMAAAMCMLSISAVPAAVTAETVVSAGTVDETAAEDSLNIREDIRERFRTYEVYSDSETKPELRLVSEPKRILKIYNAPPTAFAYNDNIDDILAGSVLSEYYIVDYYDKATEYYRIGEEELIKLNRTDGFSSVIENKAIQRLTDPDFVKKYISEDAEPLNVYYLSGKPSMCGTAIYYNTTAGEYVYYKGHISGEYLFTLADFCDYEKAMTDEGKEHTDTNWTLNEYIWDFSACPEVNGITMVERARIAAKAETDNAFEYTITEDNGHAIITGYTGTEEEIVIPASLGGLPVTEIGAKAFAGNKTIRSVNIPESIEYIRENAFADTPALTTVQFAVGVKVIENGAFMNSGVIDIRLPYSITSLGNDEVPADGDTPAHGVFENCKSLERIRIPQYLEYLGDRTFFGCEKLEDVWGFAPNLETIGRQAFEGCISLHYYSIYENVKSIGAYAFKDCTSLESLSFRNKECEIDPTAFEGSSVHKAEILPGSALERSFKTDFHDITVVYLYSDDPAVIEADGLEYRIVLYHPSQDSEAVPVAYVSGAPEGATEVTVPDTVSGELQDYPVVGVYKEAFAGQDKLTSVILPESVRSIQELAFSNTTSLKTIDLPDDLAVIEYGAFYRSGLTEITLPENCLLSYQHDRTFPNLYDEISIGPPTGYFENYCGAFEYCKELTSATLSPAMTIIPSRAFLGCSKLIKVDGLENIQETGIQTFKDCTALEELEFSEAASLFRKDTFSNCFSLKKLVIPADKCAIAAVSDLSPRIVIWCYEDSEFAVYNLPTSRKNNGGVQYLDPSQRPEQPATEPPTQKETEPPYYPTGENIKPGDANCDGRITVSDVVAILQFIASKEKYPLTPEGQLNAEVDGVKGITGLDAIVVQRMDAGIWDKS